MPGLAMEYRNGAVHLPRLGLWLDAHEPQTGPERVFVSHAHSDHIAEHREVILSAATARLMESRLPGARHEHVLNFRQAVEFGHKGMRFQLTLLPAGHIFGSAMSLIEEEDRRLLYTGDFKLRPSLSAERCDPRPADALVMETTFGRPQYVFPPTEEVLAGVVRFCRESLDNDENPVLLGYSLGKSQELLCRLGEAGLPIMLHGTVFRMTKIYEQFGQCFPPYEPYEAGAVRGKVLLCPPNVINSAMLRNLGKVRTAILTGWAVDPTCRYRYRCDAAFPLSDHADFPELIDFVKQVQPRKIWTLHGFASDFAQTLRDLGYDAQALSQEEQFALPLVWGSSKVQVEGSRLNPSRTLEKAEPSSGSQPPPEMFRSFAVVCSRIGADPRKLEKVRLLADYLRSLEGDALGLATTWFTGHPFPPSHNKVLQVGWAVLRDAMCAAAGVPEAAFHQSYLKYSDIGEAAAEILAARKAQPTLSLLEVGKLFDQLHAVRGPLAKMPLLKDALEKCTALEGKYLVKIITGDLRIGLKEGLVEEALITGFARAANEVRQANLVVGDIGETAKLAAEDRLAEAALTPFRPVKFMLASPEETATEVWERVQGRPVRESVSQEIADPTASGSELLSEPLSKSSQLDKDTDKETKPGGEDSGGSQPAPRPVWLEDKYDGIRCQLHKLGARVALYSRDLKEITSTFLDLADGVRAMSGDFVMDGEIVAMRDDKVLPFAELQKRLGRREGDLFMREEVPIRYTVFDLLWANGRTLLHHPLRQRRQTLEAAPLPRCLRLAQITTAKSPADIEGAFTAARGRGNEGLMIKDPASVYAPGRRGLAWLKLKKALTTLDCVVIGAEYGHGKRNKVLSDYTFAVRDEETGELKTIGKAYTGLTDVEIAELTEHFLQTAARQHGRYFEVPPDTVLEIAFDRLQRSDRHGSGLAMRFPRIVRIRTDKPVAEIDTLETARKLVDRHAEADSPKK